MNTSREAQEAILNNPRFLSVATKMKADGYTENQIANTHGVSISQLRIAIDRLKKESRIEESK